MNAKIVGLTRSSELETWMNNMTDTSLTENQEVYHAQINSIRLRTDMLNNALVDAAILPVPIPASFENIPRCNPIKKLPKNPPLNESKLNADFIIFISIIGICV